MPVTDWLRANHDGVQTYQALRRSERLARTLSVLEAWQRRREAYHEFKIPPFMVQ